MAVSDGGTVDRAEVLEIAHLARLRLSDEEVATFTRQLNDILAHAREIAEAEAQDAAAEDGAAQADGNPGEDAAARAVGGAKDAQTGDARFRPAGSAGAGATRLRLRAPDAPPDPLLAGPEAFAPAFVHGLFAVPRLEAMDGEPEP
jgi:aspartyl/glutamyl-tRNA(Asn/Gln) amidotransferase C subunit